MRLRGLFLGLAVLTSTATAWAIWDEGWARRPWKATQARFNEVLAADGGVPVEEGIRQVTIPSLAVTDRCQTCHLGVDRPGLEGAGVPRELRTHPRREVLLGKHPVDRVGCTPCHAGQGLQTKGVGHAAFAHGRDDPSWERPLLSKPFVQASCVACHADEAEVPQAPLFNRGLALFEDRRCAACHASRHVSTAATRAPSLSRLREKTSEAFVVQWLRDPQASRPGTRMPSFWPEPGALREGEPQAIAAFLGSVAEATPSMSRGEAGDAERAQGAALFDALGCRGCHVLGEAGPVPDEARFGPALDDIGARATRAWLERWLKNPRAVFPESRMPDLRLSDDEVSALAAFLSSRRPVGAPLMEAVWSAPPAALVEAGREAVLKYGCAACHQIPGVASAARPGPDLDDFGDLPMERIEWGPDRPPCAFSERECWTLARLQHPEALRRPDLALVMPRFELSDDDALALAVFLLSNRSQPAVGRKVTEVSRAIAAGDRILSRHNCGGCHELSRTEERVGDDVRTSVRGGHLRRFFEDASLGPPPLTFAGRKFRSQWVFDFLQRPRRIRPWLTVRMPTFTFEAGELEALLHAFAARDGQPFPFDDERPPAAEASVRADATVLLEKLQCARCHGVGAGGDVKPAERAPDLTLAASRLKPQWMKAWLLDPQALQPGTRMPTYFFLSDDDDPTSWSTPYPNVLGGNAMRQVDALVWLTTELGRLGPAVHPEESHP
ncbi:MAG: c-type cytochrome [Myxococcales bacterium]|nr:c-type cytochrome [Myxococcales bacterium]